MTWRVGFPDVSSGTFRRFTSGKSRWQGKRSETLTPPLGAGRYRAVVVADLVMPP